MNIIRGNILVLNFRSLPFFKFSFKFIKRVDPAKSESHFVFKLFLLQIGTFEPHFLKCDVHGFD